MNEYHGIVIDVSQKNKDIFKKLKIIGKKVSGEWVLYKISVPAENISNKISTLQKGMADGFYFHFYRDNELVVVFKDRIFNIETDRSTWNAAVEYGKSLGIPGKQLDFRPCRVQDEKY